MDIAVEGGQWEDSASMIAQARLLFEGGGASAKEHELADQVQARLLKATEAMARGQEALAAGSIFFCCCQPCTTCFPPAKKKRKR